MPIKKVVRSIVGGVEFDRVIQFPEQIPGLIGSDDLPDAELYGLLLQTINGVHSVQGLAADDAQPDIILGRDEGLSVVVVQVNIPNQ